VRAARVFGVAALAALASGGCGPRLDVGSDLLWTGLFEAGNFDEWSGDGNGAAWAFPSPPGIVEPTSERVRSGHGAAKLTVDAPAGGGQTSAVLSRAGGSLPEAAYYSAWYYLQRTIAVGTYWVILKFRAQDATTMDELFDLDLVNLDTGEMSLQLYDHRGAGAVLPLDAPAPVVPVSRWFQIEAFYRNAQDDTGRLTFWLDGRQIVDIAGRSMAPTPWVEWNACSIAEDLTPSTAVLYVDDCAVSRSRVGPNGIIVD
jgi:hypothetical protein